MKNIIILCTLCCFLIILFGCNNDEKVLSSSIIDTSPVSSSSDITSSDILRENVNIKNVTSEQVRAIKAGTTYQEIVKTLGENLYYDCAKVLIYYVDNEKVLLIDKKIKPNEKCELSGEELLKLTQPMVVPQKAKELKKDAKCGVSYGIYLGNSDMFVIGEQDYLRLRTTNVDIHYENGKKATEEDMKYLSKIVVFWEYVEESFPSTYKCKEIVILE